MTRQDGYTDIYLSPHLDDAVFSCGGRMWQQVQKTRSVAAVTIFAGAPERRRSFSPYAQALHDRWGHPTEAVQERQREDRAALALLGVEAVHWRFRDCIYRRTLDGRYAYTSEEALWGRVDPSDADLIETLTRRLHDLPLVPGGVLYAPLAVGGHVDHRIVRRAAEASGQAVICYEDFPYAEDREALEQVLATGEWEVVMERLSAEALEAKIAALSRYQSQASTFWESLMEMDEAVRAFARRTGDGLPAERYWRPIPGRPSP